jgi:hypothetical protein
MTQEKEKVGRLQEWILVEAYHHGESRKKKEPSAGEFAPEEMGDYCIHRDDIYQRYFKLPKYDFHYRAGNGVSIRHFREVRLKSAVILCESVRELLRSRLIQFPRVCFSKRNQADPHRIDAGRLFLTAEGVRRAKWLLSGFRGPVSEDQRDGRCAA